MSHLPKETNKMWITIFWIVWFLLNLLWIGAVIWLRTPKKRRLIIWSQRKKRMLCNTKYFFLLSFIDFRSWIPTFYCRLSQATHEDKLGISEWVQRTNERTITTEAAILISDIETQKKEHKEKATHHHYCRSSKKNQPLSPIKRKQSKSIELQK
jgi:hypothetical protein